jgi:hypothetical protein
MEAAGQEYVLRFLPIVTDLHASQGLTFPEIACELNAHGCPTWRGSKWTARDVQQVLAYRDDVHQHRQ